MERKRNKKSGRSGDLDSPQNSHTEKVNTRESPHSKKDRNKSRLRRHRSQPPSDDDSLDASHKGSQRRQRRKKKKKKSSRATTATGTTETSSDRRSRSRSRLPSRDRTKKEDKPKDLSEKDLVEWMRKMVPYVTFDSPLWNKWTVAPLYNFVRSPTAILCVAFLLKEENEENRDNGGVLSRLCKLCGGNLITFNKIIPEYNGELFYFLKIQPVSLDGLNHDEVVMFGNVSAGPITQTLNSLLVYYWTPILMDEECLPVGIKNDVFAELNTVSCATQTAAYFISEKNESQLFLYIPPEIEENINVYEKARDKEFCSRLEETVVYWITKLKQVLILHEELDDTNTWPGPLEEINFWKDRASNLKNILFQIRTRQMRQVLRILAISHSPYILELKQTFEQVQAAYQEACGNSHYMEPLRQPLEKLPRCKLVQVRVEIQKVVWLILVIWRNANYYNSPAKLNGIMRKFSNALIVHCKGKLSVKKILEGIDIPRMEGMLKMCLKCLKWWKEIYKLTEAMHKNEEKGWIFDEDKIFVHVDALILRLNDLLDICQTQKLYRVEKLPLYPGIKGPYIAGVMQNCERILSGKLEELEKVAELVLNVKNTEWHGHMKGFRETVVGIDMSVQNMLKMSFEQMPNLRRKVELMQLFNRFYGKREVVTRQLDKLCVKLYEHFEAEVARLRKLFERKVVPLPRTYTEMAGQATWADFMRKRIESDLDVLKKAEQWLPKTSGVGFQTLVKNDAKSLAEAVGAFSQKCYEDWAKEFQSLEGISGRENHRGKLEVPLLLRGKGDLVKVNFDRSVYRNLSEAEMWVRLGRIVPPVLLMTIYPWRDKLHGLKENVWVIAKWYNKCLGGLSRDERLLFKDRLLPVERKIYPCLGEYTWTSVKTADHQFLEEFRELTEHVLENVREYREATGKVAEIIGRICNRRFVKVKGGESRRKLGKVYNGVEEFKEEQNDRIVTELRKVVKGYREIGEILKDLFHKLFRGDGVEVKVQWGKYVNLVDDCMEEALKWSVRKSLEILKDALDSDDRERPFFRVKMCLGGGQLGFDPNLEEMSEMVIDVHKNLGKAVEPLNRLGRFLGTAKLGISWKRDGFQGYSEVILKDEECLEIQRKLRFAIERCISEVNLYAERWIPYRDIWEVDREKFVRNYERQYPDMEAYDRDLKRYSDIAEIVYGSESMVTIRWLQLDCSRLKEGIAEESLEWFKMLAGMLYSKGKESLTTVYNYMEENKRALTKEPESLQEQLEMWKISENVRGEVKQKVFNLFPGIQERFKLLRKYNFEMEREFEEMEMNLEGAWRKYLKFLRQAEDKLKRSKGRLQQAFLEQRELLRGKVDELQRLWEKQGPFSGRSGECSSEGAGTLLENYWNDVETLKKEEKELFGALDSFNLKIDKDFRLVEMESDIQWLKQVWKEVENWERHWNQWSQQSIANLNEKEIEKVVGLFSETFRKLYKEFEMKSWPVIREMMEFLEILQKSLKCCVFLRQNTLQARHWEWIKGLICKRNGSTYLTQLPGTPNNLQLQDVIRFQIHDLLGPISEVSWSSEKEMAVEQTLEKIQDFWENEAFILIRRKAAFEIECSPDLQDNLLDHIVSLTAMKGSKFIGVFQEKVDHWEKCLQNVSDVLGILLKTQREWVLLDKVFEKEHIQRDMPATARGFNVVSRVWSSVLLVVTQVRYVVKIVNETENLWEMLLDMRDKMEDVRKEVGAYLQGIRQEFPRFYFLPDDQLLECLGGEMEDWMEIMGKIFGNVGGVRQMNLEETHGRLVVDGLVSKEGDEELGLGRGVEIWTGPVESWMGELEREMKSSVKRNLLGFLEFWKGNWGKLEETMGSDQWTGQSVLTAVKVQWTLDVSQAIEENAGREEGSFEGGRIKKMGKKLKKCIGKLVGIVGEMRSGGKYSDGKRMEAVIVLLSYLKDVTERLHGRNCGDLESFEWLQYLRWYWNMDYEGGSLVAKQGFATIPYGWEYCAARTTVITPVTERCFLALTTAVGFQLGGIIHGGWDSGKRETINELGCQLGKLVLNLRVNEQTDYKNFCSFISGVVQTGAWAVFHGIDNVNLEVKQVIQCKLELIVKAKVGNYGRIMLDGMEVKVDMGCSLFAVVTENKAISSFSSVLRPVALLQPDSRNILELNLFLAKFESCTVLAKKIENVFQNVRVLFSHLKFFSLTSMLTVVKRAVKLKHAHGKRLSESESVIKALQLVLSPALSNEKYSKMFLDLLKSSFPLEQGTISLKGDNSQVEYFIRKSFEQLGYQRSEKMVQNCLQLYELTQVYKAVIIVGKTGAGKTVVRNVLRHAINLQRQKGQQLPEDDAFNSNYLEENVMHNDSHKSYVKEYIINPATVEGTSELFGSYVDDRWNDGIVTQILKNYQEDSMLWLVFDGPLESCWISEGIKDLGKESVAVSLANCDSIGTPPQMMVFLESDNLNDASPALMASCGLLVIQDGNEDVKQDVWKLMLQTWLNSLTNPEIKLELNRYVWKVVEDCIQFRMENCSTLIPGVTTLQLVKMFTTLLNSLLIDDHKMISHGKDQLSVAVKQMTGFSVIWSVFAGLDKESEQGASVFLKDLLPFQQIFPTKQTVFDYFLDLDSQKWVEWESLTEGLKMVSEEDSSFRMADSLDKFVGTGESVRAEYLIKRYSATANTNVLVCGSSNSGKAKLAMSALKLVPHLNIHLTPQMTAKSVQSLVETRLAAVSTCCLSPSTRKSLTIFINDINLKSGVDKASSCEEFLRYLMEYSMWYDRERGVPVAISNVGILATMATSDEFLKASQICPRLQRRFCLVHLPKSDEFQLRRIFTQKAKRKLMDFAPAVKLLADDITVATLEIYKLIATEFTNPTFSENHPFNTFTLHDISRVYEALFRADKSSQDTKMGFLRLWFHECTRIFHDRLTNPESRLACLDILEKQVIKHFELSPASIFPPRLNGAEEDPAGPVPIFGNFLKGSKCYEEIKNVAGARKVIEDKMRAIVNGGNTVVLCKEGISQVVKICRVLSKTKGHLIMCGEDGQGRETLIRVAAGLYNFKVFQMPNVPENGQHFRDILKAAYFTCATENTGCCIIVKDEQINEDVLEWTSIATSSVEIPELFAKKEIIGIYKRSQLNEKDKNGDALEVVDVMNWFKERIEKNLHIVLCVKPNQTPLLRNIESCYSSLLKQMTVNWVDIWTESSYTEVAQNLLKTDNHFKGQSSIFYSLHSLAFAESDAITPVRFINFVEFYLWYRKSSTAEYLSRMKMFKTAIAEIGNVRSKIGTLTEQAQSAEQKAEASRQDCANRLAIIQAQERDTKSQEIIVEEKNGQLNQEIKEYEELAAVIKEEWTEALTDFETETEVLQDLGEEDLTHIRSYYSPPPLVSKVLDAVMIMMDREQTWPEAKIQLGHPGFIKSILDFDKARITQEKLNGLKKFTQNKEFTAEGVSKYSNGARVMCAWIHAIEKYGKSYLSKICPKREKLDDSEQSILEHKHVLLLASEKLQLLKENLTEIQTIYETKVQLKESLEEDARKCGDILGRATSVLKLLEQENGNHHNNHVQKWKENLVALENKMEAVEENAVLSAAYLAYAGEFEGRVRRKSKEKWKLEVEGWLGRKMRKEWGLEEALDFERTVNLKEKIKIFLKGFYSGNDKIDWDEREWLVENILVGKKAKRPVLCVDPQGIWEENWEGVVVAVEGKNVRCKLMEYYNGIQEEKGNEEEKRVFVAKHGTGLKVDRQITSRYVVVDFSLSQQGLKNHFVQKIAQMICLEEDNRRQKLIQSALTEKQRIDDFAEKIPQLVITCGGASILNNGDFPETLSTWQEQVQQSEMSLEQMEKSIAEIEVTHRQFLHAAAGFTRLFESITEMSRICSFYEISLDFYTDILEKLFYSEFSPNSKQSSADDIESYVSPRKEAMEKMVDFLEENVTLRLFRFAVRSMLKHHRYQFALTLCIKTLLDEMKQSEEKEKLKEEVAMLASVEFSEKRQSDNTLEHLSFLNESQLEALEHLKRSKSFSGLWNSVFVSETSKWKDWTMDTSNPPSNFPGEWYSKLTPFQKLILISILRPDCIATQIVALTAEILGENYAQCLASCNLVDVKEVYKEDNLMVGSSTPLQVTPIIFLMDTHKEGVPDPHSSVQSLADSVTPPQQLYTLAISKMNIHLAQKLVEEGSQKGYWVYLANCHVCEDWLWQLEEILKRNYVRYHKNFRLWMCTNISATFPENIAHNSVKIAVEIPSTFQLSLERLHQKIAGLSVEQVETGRFNQLVNALCYLHCQLQGREKFSEFGNISEKWPVFQDSDFEVCLAIMKSFALKYLSEEEPVPTQQFPWWALKYMLELQYGAHFSTEEAVQFVRGEYLQKVFSPESKDFEVFPK